MYGHDKPESGQQKYCDSNGLTAEISDKYERVDIIFKTCIRK